MWCCCCCYRHLPESGNYSDDGYPGVGVDDRTHDLNMDTGADGDVEAGFVALGAAAVARLETRLVTVSCFCYKMGVRPC